MDVTFTVELQHPVSYSIQYFLIGLAVAALAAFFISLAAWRFRMILAGRAGGGKAVKPPKIVLRVIKSKYRGQINRLQAGLAQGAVTERVAFQELSRIIRQFVHEATRLNVQNFSFREIQALNIPQLTQLVREYYTPEFAESASGDLYGALGRTAQVMEAWR